MKGLYFFFVILFCLFSLAGFIFLGNPLDGYTMQYDACSHKKGEFIVFVDRNVPLLAGRGKAVIYSCEGASVFGCIGFIKSRGSRPNTYEICGKSGDTVIENSRILQVQL